MTGRVLKERLVKAAAVLVFLLLLVMGAGTTHAAVKNGLVTRPSGNIYYYQKGKLLKNSWKTVTVKKKRYKYFFGKNGAAYKAGANRHGYYNVKVFTVGKKKFGFDSDGHLVSKGIYVDNNQKILAFTSTGKYNENRSKSLRRKFRIFEETHKVSKDFYRQVRKAFGKPVRQETRDGCTRWNSTDEFELICLIYKHFEIELTHDVTTGEYAISGFFNI